MTDEKLIEEILKKATKQITENKKYKEAMKTSMVIDVGHLEILLDKQKLIAKLAIQAGYQKAIDDAVAILKKQLSELRTSD